jgi:hypothetical protein
VILPIPAFKEPRRLGTRGLVRGRTTPRYRAPLRGRGISDLSRCILGWPPDHPALSRTPPEEGNFGPLDAYLGGRWTSPAYRAPLRGRGISDLSLHTWVAAGPPRAIAHPSGGGEFRTSRCIFGWPPDHPALSRTPPEEGNFWAPAIRAPAIRAPRFLTWFAVPRLSTAN